MKLEEVVLPKKPKSPIRFEREFKDGKLVKITPEPASLNDAQKKQMKEHGKNVAKWRKEVIHIARVYIPKLVEGIKKKDAEIEETIKERNDAKRLATKGVKAQKRTARRIERLRAKEEQIKKQRESLEK